MAEKVAHIRIFNDTQGKMNLSIMDLEGETYGILAVSQFTLFGELGKGRRPYYGAAAAPEKANALYEYFKEEIKKQGLVCESGIFQTHMDVTYTNDGPVTILLNSSG